MPRQNPIEQNVRQQVAFGMNPVGAQVVARPVSQLVTPAYGDALRLTQALASVEPALQQMGEKFLKKQEEQNNFALQMQALDDGAAGKDSALPDNPFYQSSYLKARTQRDTAAYDSEVAAWREANKDNPEADFEGFISGLGKKYYESAKQYAGFTGMMSASITAVDSKARGEDNKVKAVLNAERGAADAAMGISPRSSNVDYLKGIEIGRATTDVEGAKAKMDSLLLEHGKDPEADIDGSLEEVFNTTVAGLDKVSPRALAVMVPQLRAHMDKIKHARSVIQKQQLEQQAVDSNEQGHLALARSTSSTPEEALSTMESYNDGYGNIISKGQQRTNMLRAIQTLGDENAPRALALLNAPTKDGVRLRDTKEGADLFNKIQAAHEKAMQALNKPKVDQEKFDLKVKLDTVLKTDPQKILENIPQVRANVANGLLSAEEGSQYVKQAVDAVMENEKLAVYRAQINGPMAGFYRSTNPETSALWQKDERTAYENLQMGLQPLVSQLGTEKDQVVRAKLAEQAMAAVQQFAEPRLRDAMIGRGLSPMINEILKAGTANPVDSNGNASPSLITAMNVYKTALAKDSPELLNRLDKEARAHLGTIYEMAQGPRFNGDLDATMRYLREEELKKAKDPMNINGASGMALGKKEMESLATPWAKTNGIKYMPDGMQDEVQRVAAQVKKQNPHLDTNIVMSEAFKTVALGYVKVGDRAMRIPDNATEDQRKYYTTYYEQLSGRFEKSDRTLTGVVFDKAANKVELFAYDKINGINYRETVSREAFDKDMDRLTFINEASNTEALRGIKNDFETINRVSQVLEPGSEKYDHPTEANLTGFEKLEKAKARLSVAVTGYRQRVMNIADPTERMKKLEELNIAMGGDPGSFSAWADAKFGMPIEKYAKAASPWLLKFNVLSPIFGMKDIVENTKKEILYKQNAVESTAVADGVRPANPAGYKSVEEVIASSKKSSSITATATRKENAAFLEGQLRVAPEHSTQLAFTGVIENYRGHPYDDAGGKAVGYGYNMTQNRHRALKDLMAIGRSEEEATRMISGDTSVPPLTRDESKRLFVRYTNDLQASLIKRIGQQTWDSMSKQQQLVATDISYNMGVDGALKTRALNALVKGDNDGFLRFYKAMAGNQSGSANINNFSTRLGHYSSMLSAPDAYTGLTRILSAHQR